MYHQRLPFLNRERCIALPAQRLTAPYSCTGKRRQKKLEPELKDAMDKNRLLLITSFSKKVKRVTSETASQRNRFMAELADKIFIAYAATGGNLEKLLADISVTGKAISSFPIK